MSHVSKDFESVFTDFSFALPVSFLIGFIARREFFNWITSLGLIFPVATFDINLSRSPISLILDWMSSNEDSFSIKYFTDKCLFLIKLMFFEV